MIRVRPLSLSLALVLALLTASGAVHARDKRDVLGSYRDWDALLIHKDDGSKQCFMISSAKKWTANKKNVNRGDIYITVTHRPKLGITGEVNIAVGYPLKPDSEVSATIDGKRKFDLFTQGNSAWAYDAREDQSIVTAMKAGSTLIVKGTSSRGTRTTDTYSLSGFTAAYNAITRACR